MNYEQTEDGEIYADDRKIAYLAKDGSLRMTRGNARYRKQVEEFLESAPEPETPEDEPEEETQAEEPDAPEEVPESVAEEPARVVEAPPGDEPPPNDPQAGDKSPEIIAWWFKNDPEQAKRRYAHRKGTNLDPYFGR